uniref:Uncharacterized protein n=1 Tax=Megaselia scalaris TaxID=36166 RepID=T1GIP8_MEGSC
MDTVFASISSYETSRTFLSTVLIKLGKNIVFMSNQSRRFSTAIAVESQDCHYTVLRLDLVSFTLLIHKN